MTSRVYRFFCAYCGGQLPAAKTRGRPRLTCSDRCRRNRSRFRRAIPWPPSPPEVRPPDPESMNRRTAEALVIALASGEAVAPEEQLAQGLIELDWIAYQIARLERDLPCRLAGRAGELAKGVQAVRARCFPVEVPQW